MGLERNYEFLRWLISGKIGPGLFCRIIVRSWVGLKNGMSMKMPASKGESEVREEIC